ncbi:MAG: ParD-like family protein [Planctomycetes bacterium]|nr:ParD-like family protein [Planctomycetota bacterium]
MSMPVKLSDGLVLDARLAGEAMERSIASQVEFWARLGRAVDPVLNGAQALVASRRGGGRPLAELLAEVETPVGHQRLAAHLAGLPFPHYQPHPQRPGLLVRIEADGTRAVGRFIQRTFTPVADADG